jgi:rhodanese-related sulfurtransferase
MIPIHWKSWSYAAVRIALALAFLVAGISKILDPMTFAVTIDAFGILPGPLIPPVAVFLPLLEIMGAVALIFDIRGSLGLITLMILLKKMMDEGKDMVIIDTMPYEDSYKKEHVPGALQFLFPIPDMKEWDAKETGGKSQADFEAMLGPDKNKTIVVYCGFVKCTRSHNGALWAKKLGYNNVYRFPGGIFGWKGLDYPIEKVQ